MRPNTVPMAEDVEEAESATPAQLAAILAQARKQKKFMNKVERLEKELKDAKAELSASETNALPKLMKLASLEECPLGKGFKIEIDTIVTASIPNPYNKKVIDAEKRNETGIAYMNKVAPDLVKNFIEIEYDKGDDKLFRKFMRDLMKRKEPPRVQVYCSVHSGTLGKWVRLQDKAGKGVDETALGVHRVTMAKIVEPKKKGDKV